MRQDILRVLETPEFGPAGTDVRYPRTLSDIATVRVQYSLDGSDVLTFSVPATDEMIDLLVARKIVRLAVPGEDVTEWLIARTSQEIGPKGQGVLRVECESIRFVMSDAGIIEKVVTGGTSFVNLGGINGSIENYLATFVIPHLTRRGYSWIEIGNIESNQQFDYSFEAQTATAVIEQLVQQVNHEWQLRRDEPSGKYLIDIVERIGEVITTIEAREGTNILALASQRNRERLFTSIRPLGAPLTQTQERANLGLAAWRVTSVISDDVSVEPHLGGIGAIIEDGQHVGLYLQARTGSYHEIQGSVENTQTFELAPGAGASFVVGDSVTIVADNQGTWITSVESQPSINEYGFVQGTINSNHVVNRAYLLNPFVEVPTASANIASGRIDGNYTNDTVITIKDLPPNMDFGDGVYLISTTFSPPIERISTGAVGSTDGSGTITITFTQSTSFDDNDIVVLAQRQTATQNFAPLRFNSGNGNFVGHKFTPSSEINESCNVDGNISSSHRIPLKNLPPNYPVYAGTAVVGIGSTPSRLWVLRDEVSDGSGNVTVDVPLLVSASDNQAVTLRRPDWRTAAPAGQASNDVVLGSMWSKGSSADLGWRIHQDVWIHSALQGSGLQVEIAARFAAWTHDINNQFNSTTGPRVLIRNPSSNSIIAAGSRSSFTWGSAYAAVDTPAVLQTFVTAGLYRIEAEGPRNIPRLVGTTFFDQAFSWAYVLTGFSAKIVGGPQSEFINEGSTATRIFQDGQLALIASRQWPATYTARLSEIQSEWGLPASSPALGLGAIIRLKSPSLKLDLLLRIVSIEFDPTNPAERVYVFDTDPTRLSRLSAQLRQPTTYVDVDATVVANRVRQAARVQSSPPVIISGAQRFEVVGTEPGAQPVNPLP